MVSRHSTPLSTPISQSVKFFCQAVVLSCALTTSAAAQQTGNGLPDFSPEQTNELEKAFGSYTSAVTVFTSRNGASSGAFAVDGDGGDFSVMSIPVSYTFGEDTDELRFKVRSALGQFKSTSSFSGYSDVYSEVEPALPPEFQGLPNENDFLRVTATSLTLGGGLEYRPTKNLLIEPAFDFVWTHIKQRWNYGNLVSAVLGERFDRDLFNTSVEAMTYSPSIRALYEIQLGGEYAIIPEVTYTHLWSHELWSKSRFGNFNVDSGVLQSRVTASIPLSSETLGRDIDLRPFAVRTDLYRAVKDGLGVSALWDFGADVAVEVKDSWISEVRIGGAYIYADSFDGYRLNLGAEF